MNSRSRITTSTATTRSGGARVKKSKQNNTRRKIRPKRAGKYDQNTRVCFFQPNKVKVKRQKMIKNASSMSRRIQMYLTWKLGYHIRWPKVTRARTFEFHTMWHMFGWWTFIQSDETNNLLKNDEVSVSETPVKAAHFVKKTSKNVWTRACAEGPDVWSVITRQFIFTQKPSGPTFLAFKCPGWSSFCIFN